jgi:hypothetical protein
MSNQSPLPAEPSARVERVRERNFNTRRLNLPNGFLVISEQRAKPAKWEKRMQKQRGENRKCPTNLGAAWLKTCTH